MELLAVFRDSRTDGRLSATMEKILQRVEF